MFSHICDMDTFSINTSQNVQINYNIANMGDRMLASIIDNAIIFGYTVVTYLLLFYYGSSFRESNETGFIILLIIITLPSLFFHLIFETLDNGRSPGKRVMKIQVVREDGAESTFGTYLIRWLFRLVDVIMISPVVGLIAIAASPKGQRIGDVVAGTLVVSYRHKDLDSIFNFQNFDEDYKPMFNDAVSITQSQILTIRQTFVQARNAGNVAMLEKISDTITTISGIKRPDELTAEAFIGHIIEDYYYLTNNKES